MANMSPSMGLSRGQIGKFLEMQEHGILKLVVFQNTPTAEVDRFVKEAGPGFRDASMQWLEKRFQDFTGIFRVPVNYDELNAITSAIEAGKFDGKYLGISVDEIPLIGSGQAVREVREVHFGRVMYNRDLPAALKERGENLGLKGGFKFADPLTALSFVCANPDRQRKYPLAILFTDSDGRLCCLCLRGLAGERDLSVLRSSPGSRWDGSVRFLTVCELPLAA